MPARAPRVPHPPDHSDLPGLAKRGNDSNPSRRRCPSPDSTDHPGTSDWSARGPPAPTGRRPVRAHTKRTPHPPARSQTGEAAVSFASQSPSPKDLPCPGSKQVVVGSSRACGCEARSAARTLKRIPRRHGRSHSLHRACRFRDGARDRIGIVTRGNVRRSGQSQTSNNATPTSADAAVDLGGPANQSDRSQRWSTTIEDRRRDRRRKMPGGTSSARISTRVLPVLVAVAVQ